MLLSIMVLPFWTREATLPFNLLSSLENKLWLRHANSAISMINFIKFQEILKTKIFIWLLLQNNPFQLCIEENGFKKLLFLSNMLEAHLALENKLEPTVRTLGVFLESINSKKSNNSALLLQKLHGICLKRWFIILNNSINLLSFLIEL